MAGGATAEVPAGPAPASSSSGLEQPMEYADGQRWQDLLAKYVKPQNRSVTIQLFGPPPDLKKLVTRHRLNNRRLDQTVRKYTEGILNHGVLEEMRGSIMLIEVPGSHNQYQVVGGGTLFESCYAAAALQPDNENVRRIRHQGLRNCVVLNADCPDSETMWLKRVHNKFHDGQGDTLAEMYPASQLLFYQ